MIAHLSFTVRPELAEKLRAEAAGAGVSLNKHLRNVLELREVRECLAHDRRKKEAEKGFLERFFS